MNIKIKATNLHLSDPIKQHVEDKIGGLTKHQSDLQLARIELEKRSQKHTAEKFRAEATIDAPHHVYRAEETHADLYAAIDGLIPKLVHQLEKLKAKRVKTSRKREREFNSEL